MDVFQRLHTITFTYSTIIALFLQLYKIFQFVFLAFYYNDAYMKCYTLTNPLSTWSLLKCLVSTVKVKRLVISSLWIDMHISSKYEQPVVTTLYKFLYVKDIWKLLKFYFTNSSTIVTLEPLTFLYILISLCHINYTFSLTVFSLLDCFYYKIQYFLC